jgi:hypothetical protein
LLSPCGPASASRPAHPVRADEGRAHGDGDPRRSPEERYENHSGYVKAVTKAAQKLAKDGFLLPADVQAYIDEPQASDVLR